MSRSARIENVARVLARPRTYKYKLTHGSPTNTNQIRYFWVPCGMSHRANKQNFPGQRRRKKQRVATASLLGSSLTSWKHKPLFGNTGRYFKMMCKSQRTTAMEVDQSVFCAEPPNKTAETNPEELLGNFRKHVSCRGKEQHKRSLVYCDPLTHYEHKPVSGSGWIS